MACVAWLTFLEATGLAKRITKSDQLCTAFQECCQKTSCKNLALQRPVATRWNTHCECLGRLLEQWAAVERLCESPVHSRLNLEKYLPKEHEWDLLEALRPLLKVRLLFQLYFIF